MNDYVKRLREKELTVKRIKEDNSQENRTLEAEEVKKENSLKEGKES